LTATAHVRGSTIEIHVPASAVRAMRRAARAQASVTVRATTRDGVVDVAGLFWSF
jgi:hypothetical protein